MMDIDARIQQMTKSELRNAISSCDELINHGNRMMSMGVALSPAQIDAVKEKIQWKSKLQPALDKL